MAVLQTTKRGRALRSLLLLHPGLRLWIDEKQQHQSAGVNARVEPDGDVAAGSESVPQAPVEVSTAASSCPSLRRPCGGSTTMSRQFSWISRQAPAFRVRGDDIDVLPSPASFYTTLKEEVGQAKRRIVLSSLYLGTGQLEQQLVNELHAAQRENPDLQISILLDYTRGSRGRENSRTMLLPLLQDPGSRARVSLYHTPDLRGIRRWLLPERFNETVGVQHIKVYLFDDNLILSGANLSDSYFTNRQDRYIILRNCGALGDFCERLVTSVASASFQLQPDNSVKMEDAMQHHPYKGRDSGKAYKQEFRSRVDPVIDPSNWTQSGFKNTPQSHQRSVSDSDSENSQSSQPDSILTDSNTNSSSRHGDVAMATDSSDISMVTDSSDITMATDSSDVRDAGSHGDGCDTWVYPLTQMSQFGVRVDEHVTQRLWRDASEHARIFLASGYLNIPRHYEQTILTESSALFNIITAHPKANGFLGAGFPAGAIPSVYTLVTRQLYQQVRELVQRHRVVVTEYQRPGWTFHGKGLWYYLPDHSRPSLTFIGSPNFGYRSVYRDLEAQFALVTENPRLRSQLHKEQENLYRRGLEVTKQTFEEPERHVPRWVRWFTPFLRSFF